MSEIKVVERHGLWVLAKTCRTEAGPYTSAVTYANRKQALAKAAELGPAWAVYQWGRPFFVAKSPNKVASIPVVSEVEKMCPLGDKTPEEWAADWSRVVD